MLIDHPQWAARSVGRRTGGLRGRLPSLTGQRGLGSGMFRALQPLCRDIQLLQSSQVSASHSCSEDGCSIVVLHSDAELLVLSAVSATLRRVLLTIDIELTSRRPMNGNVDAPKAANEAPPAH